MPVKKVPYFILSILIPLFSFLFVYAFLTSQFFLAWLYALSSVFGVEGRVLVGARLPRTKLLWLHIAAAVPFLIFISILAFAARSQWVVTVTAILYAVALISGAPLWYRGLKTHLLKPDMPLSEPKN